MDHLLETRALSKSFQRGAENFFAVDGIDFSIKQGELVFLTGRSGGGKTTFLNLLSGFLEPTAGQVLFHGMDIALAKDREKSRYRNRSIGYVPQTLGTIPNLTIIENVMLPAYLGEEKNAQSSEILRQRAALLLELVGILHLKDSFPRTLSGGELKRVLISRALMNGPELLIADEPTADLDSETSGELAKLFRKLNRDGVALLIVTHDTDIISSGDRVVRMCDGKICSDRGWREDEDD